MSKILVIAEHAGGKLNPSTAKCVTCAAKIGGEIDVVVLAAKWRGGGHAGRRDQWREARAEAR